MKKVAITGAMCTGKTTLAAQFAKSPGVLCVPDAGRVYFMVNSDATRGTLLTGRKIAALHKSFSRACWDQKPDIAVHDNSVLSCVGHLMAYGKTKESKLLLDDLAGEIKKFDMFVLLDPKDIVYETDAIRIESEQFRDRLQKAYEQLIDELQLPSCFISGSVEQRIKKVKSILKID